LEARPARLEDSGTRIALADENRDRLILCERNKETNHENEKKHIGFDDSLLRRARIFGRRLVR
jgi:hypothetical protein